MSFKKRIKEHFEDITKKNQFVGKGLIHRSPKLQNGNKRLLMTLDFVND